MSISPEGEISISELNQAFSSLINPDERGEFTFNGLTGGHPFHHMTQEFTDEMHSSNPLPASLRPFIEALTNREFQDPTYKGSVQALIGSYDQSRGVSVITQLKISQWNNESVLVMNRWTAIRNNNAMKNLEQASDWQPFIVEQEIKDLILSGNEPIRYSLSSRSLQFDISRRNKDAYLKAISSLFVPNSSPGCIELPLNQIDSAAIPSVHFALIDTQA